MVFRSIECRRAFASDTKKESSKGDLKTTDCPDLVLLLISSKRSLSARAFMFMTASLT